ncbi:hypothetical protein ACUNWD_11065 [Sunxiuqinia sp. A32]|uniref:hypothetical protein n=1 Tax=Sunxiuqinia sp. A32 TaxID=3461496 RepID=UPI0040452E75
MKRLILIGFMFSLLVSAYSQNLDLIVLAKGDSIACKIDSISNSHFYLKVKYNGEWRNTQLTKVQALRYEKSSINPKTYVIDPQTSKIISKRKAMTEITSVYDLPRNSVYIDLVVIYPTFHYEYLSPLNEKTGLALKTGFIIFDPIILVEEVAIITGGPKNFFEAGLGVVWDLADVSAPTLRIGYRYQAKSGFLFKIAPVLSTEIVVPMIALGYSF